jgi:hypothetical protein
MDLVMGPDIQSPFLLRDDPAGGFTVSYQIIAETSGSMRKVDIPHKELKQNE